MYIAIAFCIGLAGGLSLGYLFVRKLIPQKPAGTITIDSAGLIKTIEKAGVSKEKSNEIINDIDNMLE